MNGFYLEVMIYDARDECFYSDKVALPDAVTDWQAKEYQNNAIKNDLKVNLMIGKIVSIAKNNRCDVHFSIIKIADGIPIRSPFVSRRISIFHYNEHQTRSIIGRRLAGDIKNSLTAFMTGRATGSQFLDDIKVSDEFGPTEIAISPAPANVEVPNALDSKPEHLIKKISEVPNTKTKTIVDINVMKESAATLTPNKVPPLIYVRKGALKCARRHANEERTVETGGVMVGQFLQKDGNLIVIVTGIARGLHTIQNAASLTFTDPTWAQIWHWIDNHPDYSDDKVWSMVGWYHTHPNFGIFLSSYDKFIHEEYFKRPDHIALVIDPIRNQEGFFCWNSSQKEVIPCKYEVVDDDELRKRLELENLPSAEIREPNSSYK